MERIVEQSIRRRIWTELARLRGEQGVRRTQRKGFEPASGRCLRQSSDTRHVADATITGMTQPINLCCHTREPFAVRDIGNANASRRRNRQRCAGLTYIQGVVTNSLDALQTDAP